MLNTKICTLSRRIVSRTEILSCNTLKSIEDRRTFRYLSLLVLFSTVPDKSVEPVTTFSQIGIDGALENFIGNLLGQKSRIVR